MADIRTDSTTDQIARIKAIMPAVLVLTLVGMVTIGTIEFLRPEKDNTALITTILTVLTPTLGWIFTLIRVEAYTVHVNSKMDKLLETNSIAAEAIGLAKGIEQQQKVFAERLRMTADAEREKKRDVAEAAAKVLDTATETAAKILDTAAVVADAKK